MKNKIDLSYLLSMLMVGIFSTICLYATLYYDETNNIIIAGIGAIVGFQLFFYMSTMFSFVKVVNKIGNQNED